MKFLPSLALATGLALIAPARGDVGDVPLERWRATFDAEGIAGVESGHVAPRGSWGVSLSLGYANGLLRASLPSGPVGAVVGHRLGMSLAGSYVVWPRLMLGLELPIVPYQSSSGDLTELFAGNPPSISGGLGDLRLAPKVALFGRPGKLEFAVMPAFTVPTGQGGFRGDGSVTFQPEVEVSRKARRWRFAANLGAVLRGSNTVANLTVGSEAVARVAGAYLLQSDSARPVELAAALELSTLMAAPFSSAAVTPMELRVQASTRMTRDVAATLGTGVGVVAGWGAPTGRLFATVRYDPPKNEPYYDDDGDGLTDDVAYCPLEPEFYDGVEDTDGCPETDSDRDGVLNFRDACPLQPEDNDGFEDGDGCPDPDNDQDGVVDTADRCPLDGEDNDGFEDGDGCPEPDNDHDGVSDADDRCPAEPELVNGLDDADGCPEDAATVSAAAERARAEKLARTDTDADGLMDDKDPCPEAAEDVDGFEDGDGCPDPDNDKDGIVDGRDKCPAIGEVRNGFDDEDGCPDTAPGYLAGFIGAVQGLEFEPASAQVSKAQERTLNKMLRVFRGKEFERYTVVIDLFVDAPVTDAAAMTLAQSQADALRRWFERYGLPAARMRTKGTSGRESPVLDGAAAQRIEIHFERTEASAEGR